MENLNSIATITILKKNSVISDDMQDLQLQIVSAIYGLRELCFDNEALVFATGLEHMIQVKAVCESCFEVFQSEDKLVVTSTQDNLSLLISTTFGDLVSYAAA